MLRFPRNLLRDELGATPLECALVAALISAAIIIAIA